MQSCTRRKHSTICGEETFNQVYRTSVERIETDNHVFGGKFVKSYVERKHSIMLGEETFNHM